MKPSVYIETTIPSYLTARPSRDIVASAHQVITRLWWQSAASRFALHVSDAVLDEIRRGNKAAARRRMEIIRPFPVLGFTEDVAELFKVYTRHLKLPATANVDVVHIAFAVSYRMAYLVTWN